jgi:hypothetical protein
LEGARKNRSAFRVSRLDRNPAASSPATVQKNFLKSEKKACQRLPSSAKRKSAATNRPCKPFKKSLKKVKKKLVSLLKIQ